MRPSCLSAGAITGFFAKVHAKGEDWLIPNGSWVSSANYQQEDEELPFADSRIEALDKTKAFFSRADSGFGATFRKFVVGLDDYNEWANAQASMPTGSDIKAVSGLDRAQCCACCGVLRLHCAAAAAGSFFILAFII